MIHVSQPMTTVPEHFSTPLQALTYRTLTELSIPFQRVENDPAVTMEDCQAIDERLHMQTVKTLLLGNRQQTAFYLFVTPGDKPFRTKDFSSALGVSRVSFATPEQLLQLWAPLSAPPRSSACCCPRPGRCGSSLTGRWKAANGTAAPTAPPPAT